MAMAASLHTWAELALAAACLALLGVFLGLAWTRRCPSSLGMAAFAAPLLLALCGVHGLSALEPRDAPLAEIALTGLAALLAALLALRLPALLSWQEKRPRPGTIGRTQEAVHLTRPAGYAGFGIAAGLADEASQPLNIATLWLRRARAAREALPATEREAFEHSVSVVEDQLRRAGVIVGQIRDLGVPEERAAASALPDAARTAAASNA